MIDRCEFVQRPLRANDTNHEPSPKQSDERQPTARDSDDRNRERNDWRRRHTRERSADERQTEDERSVHGWAQARAVPRRGAHFYARS